MCKNEYNIKRATDYLTQLTGCEIKSSPHMGGDDIQLPLAIASGYILTDLEFLGVAIILAIPTDPENITPMHLAKHQAIMMETYHHPVVFVLEMIESYNISRLTRARVNFIVPGKLIFIPSLLISLREVALRASILSEKMPPVAQMLVLFHLQKDSIEGFTTAQIADLTGLAYPTVNVALRWLKSNDIIALEGGKQKHVHIAWNKNELWSKSLPFMTSPIDRILYTDRKPDKSVYSGETAMGHYTMLAEPATQVVAVDKAIAKMNAACMRKQYGDVRVEVWKYSPALLSSDGYADRLSLYLSMKDNEDERIQLECETLLDEMQW